MQKKSLAKADQLPVESYGEAALIKKLGMSIRLVL